MISFIQFFPTISTYFTVMFLFKSFIGTMAVAILGAVAFQEECNDSESNPCIAFCATTNTLDAHTFCTNKEQCRIINFVKISQITSDCTSLKSREACSSFISKVPTGLCLCNNGLPNICTPNLY